MVVKTEKLPQLGETKLGGAFFMNSGGKDANQAVAVARIGGNITFVTKVGNDIFGKQTNEDVKTKCITTSNVFIDEFAPSGVTLIMVNVAPGINTKERFTMTIKAESLQEMLQFVSKTIKIKIALNF